MLKIYSASWCPHCTRAEQYLTEQKIPFESIDIETAPQVLITKIAEVNGGEWVVPTLEFEGRWCRAATFDKVRFEADLKKLGVL